MKDFLKNNLLSLLAIAISALAAFFAYDQNETVKRISHLHIRPEIKSMFDFPKKENPIFVISNTGDIPIVSLSVEYNSYVYKKLTGKISAAVKGGYMFGDKWIFREELRPTEYEKSELIRVDPILNKVTIYQFDIKYYRETDMQEYSKQEYFFVDDGNVFNHKDYIRNSNYKKIMAEIKNVKFPISKYDPGKLKESIDRMNKTEVSKKK